MSGAAPPVSRASLPRAAPSPEVLPPRARRRSELLPRRPTVWAGWLLLLLVILGAICAPLIAPMDPNAQDVARRLRPPFEPGSPFLLGTDQVGRDVLSRIIYGSRVALAVGLLSVALAGTVGITLGLMSGYYGGLADDLIGWASNVILSFPFILLAIALVAVLGAGVVNLIGALSAVSWVVYTRVVRGEALVQREKEYVLAARALGARDASLLVHHILPNVFTPVIVIATFEVARMIISEASLSFLGLGVPPGIPSWGSMLADGREYLSTGWWIATFPGLAIMLTVLAINFVGDWLRDLFDPRSRRA
jgi:peptide/nickel transport system permease protein